MQEPIPPQINSKQNSKLRENNYFLKFELKFAYNKLELIALGMEEGMNVQATSLLWVWYRKSNLSAHQRDPCC